MWDTRYRPLKFSDVLGQKGTIAILKSRLAKGTALDTNYIFSGGAGKGKTTLGRILARAMLCQQLDKSDPEPCNECDNCTGILNESSLAFVELDAASKGTIENVRAIVDDLPFAVYGAAKRVYLIDECFTEDTLLVTPNGELDIKSLVEMRYTGEVLSFDTQTGTVVWRPVMDWFTIEEPRDIVRLTFDNGIVLQVTPDQEMYTRNRGWVPAKDLTDEDDVVVAEVP